jgi:hypothetical protein
MKTHFSIVASQTMLDAVLASFKSAGDYNRNDQVAPVAILWTDKDRQWEPLLLRLRHRLPQLLTLGAYDPATRTGPAIWLKCMIVRALPEADWPADALPILYLPGVARHELRAVEGCPKPLQPLAELQYRSAYWTQANSKDWTLLAFLQSKDGGLRLDVARDAATLEAMKRALAKLADTPLVEFQGKRLEAADFDALLTPDPARDILTWLNDPAGVRQRLEEDEWESFRNVCRQQFSFDPQSDGDLTGAEKLGSRQGAWEKVWQRFAEAPRRYPSLPGLLRRARPKPDALFLTTQPVESWPQDNEAMESELRKALATLKHSAPANAAKMIIELEAQHSERCNWVWAELGQATLAQALGHLVLLVDATRNALGGASPEAMAQAYTEGGWRADEAVLDSLACLKSREDVEAISAAIRAIYYRWLEDGASRFQELVSKHPLPNYQSKPSATTATGSADNENECVIVFADGLRFDVGQKLKTAMVAKGWQVQGRWHWVALPSVTATAKPAVSPIADQLSADMEAEEFKPLLSASGKLLTTDRFRQAMIECGYQILEKGEAGDPSGKGWTEIGDLDNYGHKQGWKLAWRVSEVISELMERLTALFAAGWKKVRIVTDHGWLLMPGGLPKSEMPAFLADTRWGRCAALKSTSVVEGLIVSWHWSQHARIAVAPGISAFKKGLEYDHGGLSLQECVAIELTVNVGKALEAQATIVSVEWFRLRCRVYVKGAAADLRLDIRTKAADAATSIATPKNVTESGSTALFVEDDSYEGASAVVVLLDADGRVIAKHPTTVGE